MDILTNSSTSAYSDLFSSLEESLSKMLSIIRKHLDMDVAFFSEFVGGRRVFTAVDQSEDATVKILAGDSDPLEDTYCEKIAFGKMSQIIHDASIHHITSNLAITDVLKIGSYIGVPIILTNGDTYGTLCCFKHSADGSLNQRDINFLIAFAEIYRDLYEDQIKDSSLMDEVSEKIRSVLELDLWSMHYQPIYDCRANSISGFESLARFNTEPYAPPNIWFSEAAQIGMGERLEIEAIKKALSNINKLNNNTYLSINISPEFILNGALVRALQNINLERVVLEVTEHSPIQHYQTFHQQLSPLRARGLGLAIDDAGAGYSSFQHVLELEADIIKLDISLIRNIHMEPKKYALAKALCAFAKATKCIIIAEGVEIVEELNVLNELGVDRIQGYLIGKPMPIAEAVAHTYHLP
ncbi:EAL domain-containing protein [Dasania sp. GY-MA-18]|uniref:EAL domain-containing protein n=1 Tax=Dasania phycosphaerae TaxID=2950436 RepID=A0A9J6RSD5_9GAMM|nr:MULTISPECIES: EAL domain-containing protein [Dasania]MCR8924420.1 EAL domain-containing protein [Dasania sp. GY-MA-18]MCZ0867095.1 EAL domain-containing protein [Dasania phycosphaerae]MCZ0870547.1 EAL domain-containing protein [Dasania phycosphaerae]